MRAKRLVSSAEGVRAGMAVATARRAYRGDVGFRTLWRLVWSWLVRRAAVQRQRRRLADLTPQELKDIGVTAEQAWRESRKPFWRE